MCSLPGNFNRGESRHGVSEICRMWVPNVPLFQDILELQANISIESDEPSNKKELHFMDIKLPDLPYDKSALEPHISARTLEYHHGKHHRAYVDKLNKAIEGTQYAGQTLEDIIQRSHKAGDTGVFNNAAQAWNHAFLWNSMSPHGGGAPQGALERSLENAFGSVGNFKKKFSAAAAGQFGSGWAWLVQERSGNLKIVTTANADTPIHSDATPLLTLDVWEHAYYLDYQNARPDYIDAFLQHLVNWDFAASNFEAARAAA